VFDNLIESQRKKNSRRIFGVGAVSLVIHTVVIAGAVYATLSAGEADNSVKVDTAMVFVDQPKQEKPPEQQPVQLDVPLKGFQTVVAPDVIPTNIPPVNLQEHFDPKDYSGTGVEGGLASGMVPTGNEVFMEAIVEEKPAVLSGPTLQCGRRRSRAACWCRRSSTRWGGPSRRPSKCCRAPTPASINRPKATF